MDTAVVDNKHRVRIPGLSPGVVVAYTDNGDNTITLTKVKAERKEPFPRGSLLKYFSADQNAEELGLLKGCVQGPSGEE